MTEENIFEEISEIESLASKKDSSEKKTDEKKEQFIKDLPDWDLEPPYEIVRRNQL